MNIFVLDKDPKLAAQMHCDKHVIKMILETAQLLSTALAIRGSEENITWEKLKEQYPYLYKPTHKNHPCTIWAASNSVRWRWLRQLGLALSDEYSYRYGKVHKSSEVIGRAIFPVFDACFIDPPLEPFAQAMPDEFKHEDAVQAYRNYYRGAKSHMLVYTSREPPEWVADIAKRK